MNSETLNHNDTWGFIGTLLWGIAIALIFILTQSIVIGIYIGVEHQEVAPGDYAALMTEIQNNGTVVYLCTISTFIICSSMILGVVKLKRNSNIKHYLRLYMVDIKTVKYWTFVIIFLIILTDILTLIFDIPIVPEFMSVAYNSASSLWLLWFAIVVAAPIFEELFFRGFLLSGLVSTFVKPIGAIIITSLLWSAIHIQYELYIVVAIFILGLILGFARIKTNSVLLTIGLHSFVNFVAMSEVAIYT